MTFTNDEKFQILDLFDNPGNLDFQSNAEIPFLIQQLENLGYLSRINRSLTTITFEKTQKMIDEMSTWNRYEIISEQKREDEKYKSLSGSFNTMSV